MSVRFWPSQLSCLGSSVGRALYLEYSGFESHLRQLIFLGKVTALGMLCFCLFV